jgi:anti-sigma regulatory factor (Ser/Thr protein kinase)
MVQRQHADELCERLVQNLLRAPARPFGDRGRRFGLRLARLRPLVRFARQDLRAWLERADLPADVVNDVTLACSEACANAVEHPRHATRPLVEIEAQRENGQLELCVRDFGSWNENTRSELRGRGLRLISELMDSLDVQRRADGTRLVMRRSFSPRRELAG